MHETMTEEKKNPDHSESEIKPLVIHGDTYYTTYTNKYKNRQNWSKPNKKQVFSFIPGTIRQILVKEGDWVNQSDTLLVLEAMKMSNNIKAPLGGMIRSIFVKEGDCVPKGTLMVEIE